jgi:hypothetical protein
VSDGTQLGKQHAGQLARRRATARAAPVLLVTPVLLVRLLLVRLWR